ncbi:MAG: spore coat protein CotJB [Ruminococcaceae bacterium]|nr:spore coat protein CotJB [Oscillospiraceae bacterium]
MNERRNLMKEIMAYSFAAHEWNLYLDTHPCDKMALEMFRRMADKCAELREKYTKEFGPIVAEDVNSTTEWTWVNDPWPWNN